MISNFRQGTSEYRKNYLTDARSMCPGLRAKTIANRFLQPGIRNLGLKCTIFIPTYFEFMEVFSIYKLNSFLKRILDNECIVFTFSALTTELGPLDR
jgi:hypothetical protein